MFRLWPLDMPGVRADDVPRRVILHHDIELPCFLRLPHPHPQLPGVGPDQLCEVARLSVGWLGVVAVPSTLLVPTDHGLPAPALPARVAAPAPVKVLPQVRVSAVLERVSAGQPGNQLSSQICGLLGETRPKSQKMQQS